MMADKRDGEIAHQIEQAQTVVRQLQQEMAALTQEAFSHGAHAHGKMYHAVFESLYEAWKALDAAWEVMDNGDPADYESDEARTRRLFEQAAQSQQLADRLRDSKRDD